MLAAGDSGVPVLHKPISLARRIIFASVTFLLIGALIFAAAGGSETGRVAGAGSTFAAPILQRVSTAYQGYLAADRVDVAQQQGTSGDWVADGQGIDYDPVGSVGGLVRLSDPKLSFAATEVPLSAEELAAQGLVQFPLILGAVAPVVNLDLGGADLTLDAVTLAAIYTGTISDWSDPAIAALNPGVVLPAQPIAVVRRSDGSGTTHTFTGFLAASGAWAPGQSAQPAWPVGAGAEGSRGVIAAVKATAGAIGYVEVGQARRASLQPVRLVNAAGQVTEPTATGIRAAAAGAAWQAKTGFVANLGAAADPAAWPMTAVVYAVMPREGAGRETKRTLAFFHYFYAEATRSADILGYVPLPEDATDAVAALWHDTFQFGS